MKILRYSLDFKHFLEKILLSNGNPTMCFLEVCIWYLLMRGYIGTNNEISKQVDRQTNKHTDEEINKKITPNVGMWRNKHTNINERTSRQTNKTLYLSVNEFSTEHRLGTLSRSNWNLEM